MSVITHIASTFIERLRSKLEMQQKAYQSKIENLNDVYKTLISILNLFPNSSPNDILKNVDYAPNYSMEHFEATIKALDYQIEDYKKQLNETNINFELKEDIETQILNREYSKNKIAEIRDKYYKARDKYKSFCESDRVVFDLYAGQDVRNSLVEFEVVIYNVFVSGYRAGDEIDPIKNNIHVLRRNLINSMRNDIGIY